MITREEWAEFIWYVHQAYNEYEEIYLDGNRIIEVFWGLEEILVAVQSEPNRRYTFHESLHDGITTERLYTSITFGKRKEIGKDV